MGSLPAEAAVPGVDRLVALGVDRSVVPEADGISEGILVVGMLDEAGDPGDLLADGQVPAVVGDQADR